MLLGSHLGNPERKPLTRIQLWQLGRRVREADWDNWDRDLTAGDLRALGYGADMADRILRLLDDQALLEYYVNQGRRIGCIPMTRLHAHYPHILRQRLGEDAPLCLWTRGDLSVLEKPGVALVGSRALLPKNQAFARAAGVQAARQGYALISGNARGADQAAQNASLQAGGWVVSIVADELTRWRGAERLLYMSEDGYAEPFTNQRALSRNRIIHAMGDMTLVAQCREEAGGTWSGTMQNLRQGWSPVACFDDGSRGAAKLEMAGAVAVGIKALEDFSKISAQQQRLWDEV